MKKKEKGTNLTAKTSWLKSKKTLVALAALAIFNVFALSSATFAWFYVANNEGSKVNTFSGDLDVEIEKVSAYKYVYPYHNNSADFVNYDGVGQVKSYVVEDNSIEAPSNLSNTVTYSLGVVENQSYATNSGDANKGPRKIHYETSQDFKYDLIGNSIFTGVTNDEWSTLTATRFSRRDVPVVAEPVIVENVVISVGAEFIFFDAHTITGANCSYFTYNSPSTEAGKNSRFEVVDSNRLRCLKSGIYTIQYRVDGSGNYFLDLILTSRNDNAIIGTNMIDPTKITIDYRGSASTTYATIQDYLPVAIQNQNTMVVLDVQIKYINKNPIDIGLKITRDADDSRSIYNFTDTYDTTDPDSYLSYVDSSQRNPLHASDFYAFYSEIAMSANAYATPSAAWHAFHDSCQTDYETIESGPNTGKEQIKPLDNPYNKFVNDPDDDFDRFFVGDLHPKTISDSTLVPASATNNIYHFYIAIDYDYEYMNFFIDKDRVGKTFLLDRDFQFYFLATEHIVTPPSPSPLLVLGGEKE